MQRTMKTRNGTGVLIESRVGFDFPVPSIRPHCLCRRTSAFVLSHPSRMLEWVLLEWDLLVLRAGDGKAEVTVRDDGGFFVWYL